MIYVKPEGGDPQVTFDNNAKDNHWYYHAGKVKNHLTGNCSFHGQGKSLTIKSTCAKLCMYI